MQSFPAKSLKLDLMGDRRRVEEMCQERNTSVE